MEARRELHLSLSGVSRSIFAKIFVTLHPQNMVDNLNGRAVYRSNNNANANGGLVYSNANNASSNSNTNYGARLELRATAKHGR